MKTKDRKWKIENAIRTRNCKNLNDVKTVIILQKYSERYGKFPNRQRVLEEVFKSDYHWIERKKWIDRVIDWSGPRGENYEWQHILHNSDDIAKKLKTQKTERASGEKNPGYNHGGRLSIFSDNFIGDISGKEDALEKMKQTKKSNPQNENTRIEYYLSKGFGLCESIETLKERQAVGRLDKFIERYGEVEGKLKWEQRQEKWIKSHFNGINYSQISQELFNSIIELLDLPLYDIYFATYDRENMAEYKNKEYRLKTTSSYILPDFICLKSKKIIEFNGDYWHSDKIANPLREKNRNSEIKKCGFEILHIKEFDYKKDKQGTIQKCIDFLKQ